MATDRPRGIIKPRRFLSPIGLDIPAWLQTLLHELKTHVENLIQQPGVPGVPSNLLSTTDTFSNPVLYWNFAPNAVRYRVYQNAVSNFNTALLKGETTANRYVDNREHTFFATQLWLNGSTNYWVAGVNSDNVEGNPAFVRHSVPFTNISNLGTTGDVNIRAEDTGTSIVFTTSAMDRARFDEDGWLVLEEVTDNPVAADLAADSEVAIYRKSDTFAIAYNSLGTVYYLTIPLNGIASSISISTTGP